MKRELHVHRGPIFGVLLALCLMGLGVGAAPAHAATTFAAPSLQISVNGGVVSAALQLAASPSSVQVERAGVCVRNAAGANFDLPLAEWRQILTSGTWLYPSRSLPAGTYQGRACVLHQGTWHSVGSNRSFMVSSSPSGEPMPTAAPPGWRRVFADDFLTDVAQGGFASSSYQQRWGWYPKPWRDTSGNGAYNPDIISVSGGVLSKNLRTIGGQPQVAAIVPKLQGGTAAHGQLYGRYTVRFRADSIQGFKVAWLQWPDSEEWDDGEIDFPEGDLTGTIGAYHHCANIGDPERNCFARDTTLSFQNWHTATLEWTPGRVSFFLDGQQIGTSTEHVPSTSMHWVLQTETRLTGGPPPAAAAGRVQIDWVVAEARA